MLCTNQAAAITWLIDQRYGIIVLDLVSEQYSAFAIFDFAHHGCPEAYCFLLLISPSLRTGKIFETIIMFARICKIWHL